LARAIDSTGCPVTELLDSDAQFVDKRLARHYGLPFAGKEGEWTPVTGLRAQGRGGIFGMAVFLTKNSQATADQSVKRGFWVVHKVLGEHIPAPPADVVALPAKETDTNGKTHSRTARSACRRQTSVLAAISGSMLSARDGRVRSD